MNDESFEMVIYVLRPNNEPLWLPQRILDKIGAEHGDRLTTAQYEDPAVQQLLAERRQAKR